jgi:DNA-binding beta-propeller fold protein YncE
VDWVGNNLYWTNAFYARIEVMDLDTRHRRELMRTGSYTQPGGIAVDPRTR